MPEQVTEEQVPQRQRRSRYNFEEWANGEWWRFTQGEDFEGKSFPGTARAWAKRSGYGLETRTSEEGKVLYLRFTKANGDAPSAD